MIFFICLLLYWQLYIQNIVFDMLHNRYYPAPQDWSVSLNTMTFLYTLVYMDSHYVTSIIWGYDI